MEIKLNVNKVTVLRDKMGMDTIYLHISDMPSPYLYKDYPGSFRMETTNGYGIQWCQEVLGINPEDIQVTELG